MKNTYWVMTWQVKKQGYVNNFVRGWEVFTSKKAMLDYKKILDDDVIVALETAMDAQSLNDFLQQDNTSTKKVGGAYVEQIGVQFH